MDRNNAIFRPLHRFALACTAGLLTSVAAYATPVVTISAYGIDLNSPYGYQKVGTTDNAEVWQSSGPYQIHDYPATFEGYGYANGATGVLRARASATGAFITSNAPPWRYVETWATASGVITVGGVDGQTGTVTLRQAYDGSARITGTGLGGSGVAGLYGAWVSYRKVGETGWHNFYSGETFLSPTLMYYDFHELVFNAIAGERYEIYEGLMTRAEVNFGHTTDVDFSHTSILSITSSGGITVSGQDGFLADLLNQPVNSVPEPTSLALLLAGLSAGCFGWRKKQA